MVQRKAGAPKGGRVHWLLWHLPREFKGVYLLSYDYAYHNYIFYRMERRRLYDVFIVQQTSKHYWHMTYANCITQKYEHFGNKTTLVIAEEMCRIYNENAVTTNNGIKID